MNSIKKSSYIFLFSILFFFACKKDISNTAIPTELKNVSTFSLLDTKTTGINFNNKVEDREDFNILSYRNYYNGGGVAIGDINNDGLNDIYFSANMSDNQLYLNKGDMKFENITKNAGVSGKNSWCTGVTMADVNADGWLDIYVCYSGAAQKENKENELFINNKNNTFTESAKAFGLNDSGLSTHASFFDFDLDGDLDCYVLNNSYLDPEKISYIPRAEFDETAIGGDRLYRNDGMQSNGIPKFTNITRQAGLYSNNVGFGLGLSVGDVNGDFYPDIYISNDFWERDYLYINQRNGSFKEELSTSMSYTSLASMGSDIADLNNDGHLDIFSTDMLPTDNKRLKAAMKFEDYNLFTMKVIQNYHFSCTQNCLQLNRGDGKFTETAFHSGVAGTDWSWGALIFDMNLDGKKDIFVSNGVYNDITDSDFTDFIADQASVKNIVLEKGKFDFRDFVKYLPPNKRKNYTFINTGHGMIPSFGNAAHQMGMDQESFSNGSAYSDLDNDGDQDLVVNNVNMDAFIYKNNAEAAKVNYIKLKFKGGEANPFGIGALVKVYHGDSFQIAQNLTARGFQSSVAPEMIFGLGQLTKIDSMAVIWPNKKYEILTSVTANKEYKVDIVNARLNYIPKSQETKATFAEQAEVDGAIHIENNYVDYDVERLMPHVLSTEGPKLIKGDVNGDKKEDFILQGASNSPDKLFINIGNGFKESPQISFEGTKKMEPISGALFDADQDGDLDYLAGMGGNEFRMGVDGFQAQFYLNDGKGNFSIDTDKAPKLVGHIGCIRPCDFDGDGDLDIFAGGKAIPGSYGLIPRSFLLRNEGFGVWTDITDKDTGPIGMVTDATWSDVNNDKWPDLIVVGEWMPVKVFVNKKGKLEKPLAVGLSEGWWNTIEAADIDNDGDTDYLLGNWGTNMKLKASETRPIKIYVADFDDNKKSEGIIEWFTQDDAIPYPFASRADMYTQLPHLKKSGLKYQEYATKTVTDLLKKEKLEKSTRMKVTNFHSSILLNNKGNLELKALQDEAQLSPIFAFEVGDFDKDGITDFYAGGNFFRLKPEIGRHEGFHGGYYKGKGNGKFVFIKPNEAGLVNKGEVRDAIKIDNKLIVSRNNNAVSFFKF
jgi:enediyne biosynthesis protein E4